MPGLDGVAEEAERGAGGEAAQRAELRRRRAIASTASAAAIAKRSAESGAMPRPLGVGLLGEDRHRAEAGG